ncbi:hypothetical protein [Streptomyces sp. NRRL B-3229]|uniref:hypothetical protein n=1 Tax=Streptomyces sp. NRRL B-3229 TaxID=1463836 RepID=UPI0004BF96EA|nr:hypothetical protein [Streptomyces sp. NRRL B-3229]
MPMLLIKGLYGVKGTQSGGGTVAFTAADPSEWDSWAASWAGRRAQCDRPRQAAAGRVRRTGDALRRRRVHQPLRFAHAASDAIRKRS